MVQWLAGNGGLVTEPDNNGNTPITVAAARGHDGVAAFLTAAASWSAFKIMVACRLAADAKLALRSGRLNPFAGRTSLAELVAVSTNQKDGLWTGSPDVCRATYRLVHDAMAPWTPSRHFLFHARVRSMIRTVLLVAKRLHRRHSDLGSGEGSAPRTRSRTRTAAFVRLPNELWCVICSFFLRTDWASP